MERVWLNELIMLYPKRWIVAVNVKKEKSNKLYVEAYKIVDTQDEALSLRDILEQKQKCGRVEIVKGFDDTPKLGDIKACKA